MLSTAVHDKWNHDRRRNTHGEAQSQDNLLVRSNVLAIRRAQETQHDHDNSI